MTIGLKIKNCRYYAVINYSENGKYKQKWISLNLPVKNNKHKAEQMLDSIRKQYEDDSTQPIKFCDYMQKWLESKRGFVEQSTYEGYLVYVNVHLVPYFKTLNKSLNNINSDDIEKYYLFKSKSGRKDNKNGGLSYASIKKHSAVLHQIFDNALKEGLIVKNPTVQVKLPIKKVNINRRFLTSSEANNLLKAFDNHILKPLIYVTLYYGLRRSEVLGLRWSAIDLKAKTITINHTVVKNLSTVSKDRTKNESSYRVFKLIPNVEPVITELRKKQEQNKEIFGSSYICSDYVFTWDNGKPFSPDFVSKSFGKQLKKCGLPAMRFHDLRHSTASILYDMGWGIKDIQYWLRHSSVDTTADIYTHISKDRKAMLADQFDGVLNFTD